MTPAALAILGLRGRHLQIAVERHQAGLDRQLGLVLGGLAAELGKHLAMRRILDLGRGGALVAVGDAAGPAIAMIDGDDLLDVVKLHGGAEVVPERPVPRVELRATTPIAAPAKVNWLYFPMSPCFSM